jgi:hypothetical protein
MQSESAVLPSSLIERCTELLVLLLLLLLLLGVCTTAGGLSSWSSSISVHNEIVRSRPDLAEVLAGPHWFYDRKGEVSFSHVCFVASGLAVYHHPCVELPPNTTITMLNSARFAHLLHAFP